MTKYELNIPLAKWEKQNDAELIDAVDGCLLDDLLYRTKRGYALFVEVPVNCWTSKHMMLFSRNDDVVKEFYAMRPTYYLSRKGA